MSDSTTGQQLHADRRFSGACMTEDDYLYDESHGATNCDFANHKNPNLDRLRDKFDSISLVEKIQKDTIQFDKFETPAGFGTDIDGNVIHCRGTCTDVNKVYEKDKDGDTLLHIAIIILAEELASYFINRTPWLTWLNIQNKLFQTALHLAFLTNQVSLVRRLVVAGADTESRTRAVTWRFTSHVGIIY